MMPTGSSGHSSTRNLWIILGTVVGVFTVASVVCVYWICRKRSRRRSIFSIRAVTPLDDAEIESWRRPSEWTQRTGRYTVMPKKPLPVARVDTRRSSVEKDWVYERPHSPTTPLSPNFSRPMSSQKSPQKHVKRRNSSIYSEDRPPTPYSQTKDERNDTVNDLSTPASPPRTRSLKSHHRHYPSVSEVSEFDFDFERSGPRPLPRSH